MESHLTYEQALAALEWHIELGAEETILDAPVDRYALGAAEREARAAAAAVPPPDAPLPQKGNRPPVPPPPPKRDLIAEATAAASAATDLPALQAAFAALDTPLSQAARNFIFAGGTAGAALMVIGDAPSRDDDSAGTAFRGAYGALLDRMLAAIGHGRVATESLAPTYLSYSLPWRLPAGRLPAPDEIAIVRPFLLRHITLAAPKAILLQGNLACMALLGRGGLTRLRGSWADVAGIPALPSHGLEQLYASPLLKREAWADLLALKARLD